LKSMSVIEKERYLKELEIRIEAENKIKEISR